MGVGVKPEGQKVRCMIYVFSVFESPGPKLNPGIYLKFVIETFVKPVYLDLGCFLSIIVVSSVSDVIIELINLEFLPK